VLTTFYRVEAGASRMAGLQHHFKKKGCKKVARAVALTLFSLDKQGLIFINRGDCNALRIVQIESNTAEAW